MGYENDYQSASYPYDLDEQSFQFSGPQQQYPENTTSAPALRQSARHRDQTGLLYQTSVASEWMDQHCIESPFQLHMDSSSNTMSTTPTLSWTSSFEEPACPDTPSSMASGIRPFVPGYPVSQGPTSPSLSESSLEMLPDCALTQQNLQANGSILSPLISSLGRQSQFDDEYMLDQSEMPSQAADDMSSSASVNEENMEAEGEDETGDNPRTHEWYGYEKTDDRYTCPCEDCDWEGCKLRCDYHKHIDKHLLPYACNRTECEKNGGVQRFSSRACLLRHEREKHRLHNASAYYCRYIGPGKCDRTEGYGRPFPRSYNAEDHMKRCHDPSELAPAPTPKKQRRRRTSNVSRGSSKSGRSSSSTTPTMPSKGPGANNRDKPDTTSTTYSTFEHDFTLPADFQDMNPFLDVNALQVAYSQQQTTRAGQRPRGSTSTLSQKGAGIAKARRPTSADRVRKMEEMIQCLRNMTSHDPRARQVVAALEQLHTENVQEMMTPVNVQEPAFLSPQPVSPQYPPFSAIDGNCFLTHSHFAP